jgi:hypothetical protein
MPGGLGDHGEEGAEGGFGARSIEPGSEARIPAFGIAIDLHLVDDRVRVREDADLVQDLVIDVRPNAKVKPKSHRFGHRSATAAVAYSPERGGGPSRSSGQGAGQAGVSNPPSPMSRGEFPTSRGIRPVIGPPLEVAAAVESVASAPSGPFPTHRSGVMPCTCATAGPAGISVRPAIADTIKTLLHRSVRFIDMSIDLLRIGDFEGLRAPVDPGSSVRFTPGPAFLQPADRDGDQTGDVFRSRQGHDVDRRR